MNYFGDQFMRTCLFITALFFSVAGIAQSEFSQQFRSIISDATNGFLNFRGTIQVPDSFDISNNIVGYQSLITLASTKNNFISIMETPVNKKDTFGVMSYTYNALIADSLKTRKGVKVCDEWSDKISFILGVEFTSKKYQVKSYSPGKYGWNFSNEDLYVSLTMLPVKESDLHSVWLTVSHSIFMVR